VIETKLGRMMTLLCHNNKVGTGTPEDKRFKGQEPTKKKKPFFFSVL
jgi:hypothetical protein